METKGTLAPERSGYSMPVDAQLYPRPPFHFPDTELVVFTYETDADAAAAALPAGLTLPLPAVAQVTLARYPSSSLGPYNEAVQQIMCEWEGERRSFVSRILLDNDAAIAAGREIYGFPKKHAYVELRREDDTFTGVLERPRGHRLLSAKLTLEQKMEVTAQSGAGGIVNLRVIPDVADPDRPSVMELTEVMMPATLKEAWSASGSLEFGEPSEADPWSALPVRKLMAAHYTLLDFELPPGRVLKRY